MEGIVPYILSWVIRIVGAIVVWVVGKWASRKISNLLRTQMERREVDSVLVSFAGNATYFVLLILVMIMALSTLGIQTASLIAAVGAATLAIGLALQGSLANLASGVLIVILKPFKIGDFIMAGGTSGIVEDIQLLSTTLRSPDNKEIHIPNGSVMGGAITNISARETRRVDLVFGISYGDDIDKAKEILTDILAQDERILDDPAPQIALSELGDSSVNFVVRPWVKAADYWAVNFETTEAVKKRFDAAGISIPFPQRDVHIYQESA